MTIGIGVWAFIVYLSVVIIWSSLVKRSITEAMILGFLVAALFGGIGSFPVTVASALYEAATTEIVLATMMFVFMSAIMAKTGIIGELVEILNSIIGRIKGGPAYIAVIASALMGLVSGSSPANAATVGTITIPWMIQSGWPKEAAATITAGNAGSGQSFPASNSMFLMLAMPAVAAAVSIDYFYGAMLTAGLWCVLYRLIIVRVYVSRYHIAAIPGENIQPLGSSLRKNWTALLMFVSIIVPLILKISPLSKVLSAIPSLSDGMSAVSIVLWVPILMSIICIIEGRKHLPHDAAGWIDLLKSTRGSFLGVGGVLLFAIAGSNVLEQVGFGNDLNMLLSAIALPKVVMIFVVGIMVALVGGPLGGVATTMAMGAVTFSALTGVGVSPIPALAAFLVWVSTEGATPPSSAPIFVTCGLAELDEIQKTFIPLIFHYVVPILMVGVLIALGILPIANAGVVLGGG